MTLALLLLVAALVSHSSGTSGARAAVITPGDDRLSGDTGATGGWVGSWSGAPSGGSDALGTAGTTVRDVVHTSLGGSRLRVWLSNEFGTTPLLVAHVTVALPVSPGSATAEPATMREVTFGDTATVTVPVGAAVVSDPVALAVPAEHDLLVSAYVPASGNPATFHLHAQQTSYYSDAADHAADSGAAAFTRSTTSWFYVDEVDVLDPAARGTVAALGDSLTDGVTSTVGEDHRWPDFLADRLLARPAGPRCGVLNAGISGNRLLLDGSAPDGPGAAAGPSAVARIGGDVLSRTAVRTVVVFEGVNDIVQTPSQLNPAAIIEALRQLVNQAHAAGVRVVGATITPFEGWSDYDPSREAVRQAVNAWIRHSGVLDEVVDFDAVLRDPADPRRLAPAYDSGDHLHPDDAGYLAMASALDLAGLCPA